MEGGVTQSQDTSSWGAGYLILFHVCKCESLRCSVVSTSLWPYGLWPARLLCPWNSPGKNTGVGSHSLLQGIFPTQGSKPSLLHCRQILYCLSHQGSPIFFHTVALYPKWEPCQNFLIKRAKDSLLKVKVTQLCLTLCDPIDCSPWNSPGQNTGVGSCCLLQRIFPTQGLNPGLPHYKWILYQLSHNGSQKIHYLTHTINSLFCMMYKYSLILWCAIHACHTLWGKKITTIMVFKKSIL